MSQDDNRSWEAAHTARAGGVKPLRIAALVKQVPKPDDMQLGSDGRLRREGLEQQMNPYCQRAVAKGVELAEATGGSCTVFSLGPPAAEDVVRWGVASGAANGILISDPAFAGSDTLATARALAAALRKEGPFDLILVGKNSVDADTGQVGPELAEMLGLPFATAVRKLEIEGDVLQLGCEQDDGWVEAEVALPALLATAERLCAPAKTSIGERTEVPSDRIRTLRAADLGEGPWGQAGSPTVVGETKVLEVHREKRILRGPLRSQIEEAVSMLTERGALAPGGTAATAGSVTPPVGRSSENIAVLCEPERSGTIRELLGAAARLAGSVGGRVIAIGALEGCAPAELSSWGADRVLRLEGSALEEDLAASVSGWCRAHTPWAVLAPSTAWGREVASRVAARLAAGLTGDAIELDLGDDGRLIAWKPAFGGRLVAAIRATSPIQIATVRPGVLPRLAPRAAGEPEIESRQVQARCRLRARSRKQTDQLDVLALARHVVGVGQGIPPERYSELDPLLGALGAELAATRKVTDKEWLPRSRQVGLTGRSIAPALYVALAISGKFNHICGIQAAETVLAVNSDRTAPVFEHADIGIVADWAEVVALLAEHLGKVGGASPDRKVG